MYDLTAISGMKSLLNLIVPARGNARPEPTQRRWGSQSASFRAGFSGDVLSYL